MAHRSAVGSRAAYAAKVVLLARVGKNRHFYRIPESVISPGSSLFRALPHHLALIAVSDLELPALTMIQKPQTVALI
jgi:hypothetical protein